ncbi:B-cell receptor CD22 [Menidia menidia]
MIEVLLFLMMKPGVESTAVGTVTFENPDYCAFTGSSVQFKCFYNYSDEETVRKTSWYKGEMKDGTMQRVSLSLIPSYQNRWIYRGDDQHNCSLELHDLQDSDTGYYFFRFDTNKYGWRSKGSLYLSVTELQATVSPQRVRVGNTVTLECKTTCQLPIVWLRDGHRVTKSQFRAQAEDAGNYSCSAEGPNPKQSHPVALDVWYPPINVSIEVSGGDMLTEGSSVNLTCNSVANPAADGYTWYRTAASSTGSLLQVGSGQVLTISPMEESHNGLYVCQAKNPVGQNNSTMVLVAVGEEGINRFIVLGIRVLGIIVMLLLPLAIVCAWRRSRRSTAEEERASNDYENITVTEFK